MSAWACNTSNPGCAAPAVCRLIISWRTRPGFEVLQAHADIVAQSTLGDRALRHLEQIRGSYLHIVAFARNLIGRLHHRVKLAHRDRDQSRMGHPGAVVPNGSLAMLFRPH